MLEVQLRQAATVLLESAIRIAPPHTRDWGRAMMGELNYVEGPWAGTLWALGSSGVLVKQTIVSLIIPSTGNRDFIPDGGLFARSAALRKAALAIGAACVLAALLFFAAPPFRQAFRVAVEPWHRMYRLAANNHEPDFASLARRAELHHDPEGLAFCAVRFQNPSESVRLAEEAVRLDPNLIWVYAVVILRHPEIREASRWIATLERWDAQNALFPLIAAESMGRTESPPGVWAPSNQDVESAWRAAMAQAFQASKFDDYFDRVAELNRKVVPRYHYYDPYEVESRIRLDLPSPVIEASERFALSLIHSGQDLEAKGDLKGASEQYWKVAHYGQLIDAEGHTAKEHWSGDSLQAMAYKPLKALAEKEGNSTEAALFAYLSSKFNPITGEQREYPGESAFGHETSERNAAVVQVSGLMIILFSGLLVIAISILIVGSRRRARPGVQRAKPVATLVVLTSAVGLLFSSITLYLTYRPYWYIFQTAILNGDGAQNRDLQEFLGSTQTLPGIPHRINVLVEALFYSGSPGFLFYFWAGVTLLGVFGLALIVIRRFLGRPHSKAP